MKTQRIKETELAALEVMRQTGVDIIEAALVAKDALEAGHGRVKRAKECIAAGAETLRMREKTVTFEHAVQEALEARKRRRTRTLNDFRYVTKRLMLRCKGLAKRRVRSITPAECAAYLLQAFDTPRQRNKARLILSGVFSTACKRGWCAENPIGNTEPEQDMYDVRSTLLRSRPIAPLPYGQMLAHLVNPPYSRRRFCTIFILACAARDLRSGSEAELRKRCVGLVMMRRCGCGAERRLASQAVNSALQTHSSIPHKPPACSRISLS